MGQPENQSLSHGLILFCHELCHHTRCRSSCCRASMGLCLSPPRVPCIPCTSPARVSILSDALVADGQVGVVVMVYYEHPCLAGEGRPDARCERIEPYKHYQWWCVRVDDRERERERERKHKSTSFHANASRCLAMTLRKNVSTFEELTRLVLTSCRSACM